MALLTNKYLWLLGIALFIWGGCGTSRSLEKTTSGIVYYDIELDLTEQGQVMAETFGERATVWFNQKYVRLQKESNVPNEEFFITDLATGTERAYIQFSDQKYAVLPDPRLLPGTGPLQFSDEIKSIAGFRCKKATAQMGSGEMVVYYTTELGINYCPYLDLEGFALEYTLVLPFGQVTYRANAVDRSPVALAQVDPPTGFRPINYQEFQQEMMNNFSTTEADEQEIRHFRKPDLNGNWVDLADYRGEIVVLNFWFTTCPPCLAEIPDLNRLFHRFQGQPVHFFALTFEPSETLHPFLLQHPFDFQIVPDAVDVMNDFEINLYPTTIVLDKNGKIAKMILGGKPTIEEDLQEIIEELQKN